MKISLSDILCPNCGTRWLLRIRSGLRLQKIYINCWWGLNTHLDEKIILCRYCGTQVVVCDFNMIGKPKSVNIYASRGENCYPTHCVAIAVREKFLGEMEFYLEYLITPYDSTNALGGTIFDRNVIDSATDGSGGGTGGKFRFSP